MDRELLKDLSRGMSDRICVSKGLFGCGWREGLEWGYAGGGITGWGGEQGNPGEEPLGLEEAAVGGVEDRQALLLSR